MLPLVIDRSAAVPLAAQIAAGVRGFVADGVLEADQALPSSRALAGQLGVARGTVVAAYDQLVSEGYLVARAGGATRIHPDAGSGFGFGTAASPPPAVSAQRSEQTPSTKHPERTIDLRPNRRPAARLDDPAWREAWRKAATAPRAPQPTSAAGLPELRVAIAEHLRLMRAMVVDPESIIVTGGARDGLALVLAALGDAVAPVALENPGYPGLRRVLQRRGVTVAAAPVDVGGIVPAQLPSGAGAVLVTPNHLYPVGGSMPAVRRIELLRHAAEHGLLVIEDDFDSDFRHVGAPLPTLRDLSPATVVHLGTFSQVLTADAGVGYIIGPPTIRDALARAAEDLGPGTPVIAQRAVADFLRSGGLRRRITRRRRALIRRRDLLLEHLDGLPVEMISGAHAVIRLASADAVRTVLAELEHHDVLVGDLAGYWSEADERSADVHSSIPLSDPGSRASDTNTRPSDSTPSELGIVIQCADTSRDDLTTALRIMRSVLLR